jgi:hypothetical protein
MRIPNAASAIVDRQKIEDYLLNSAHPDNGGKAAFFFLMGFAREQWQTLAVALRTMAANASVVTRVESIHGEKYVLEAEIETPSGRTPSLRSVWIVDRGANAPRLVTCYPTE